MLIDSRNAAAIRQAIQTGRTLPNDFCSTAQFTLAGLLECIATLSMHGTDPGIAKVMPAWLTADHFKQAWRIWNQGNDAQQGDIHGTRRWEFHAMHVRTDQTGTPFQLFQERFVRSLKALGTPRDLAYAYAGALAEMTDNIIQHSTADLGNNCRGLAGYHVQPGYFAFSVVDVGQGILASLRSSSRWAQLGTPEQALRAAVCDNATRRSGHEVGDGFKQLFRSMADRACQLRFRSDDAGLSFAAAGTSRTATSVSIPPLQGFQVSCFCPFDGLEPEKEL